MRRGVSEKNILDLFVEDFCRIVKGHCKYILFSGFVAIAHGRSRATEDIDIIIEKLSGEDFISLHEDLVGHGFECMQSYNVKVIYRDYLREGSSVRYTRKGKFLLEMKLKFSKDELDEEQIDSRQKIPFTKLDVYFSSIEGNIAFKEKFLGADKDLEDAQRLRIIYEGELNEEKIKSLKKRIREKRFGK